MITYTRPTIDLSKADLSVIAEHMYALMMRNVASDGFVRDLTWSYASFLSAVRAKTGLPVEG